MPTFQDWAKEKEQPGGSENEQRKPTPQAKERECFKQNMVNQQMLRSEVEQRP